MSDMAGNDHDPSAIIPVPNDLLLDHSDYYEEIAEANIPEEKVHEVLDTLWNIMRLFVECGFNVDVAGRAAMEIFNQAAREEPKDEA